MTTTIEKTLSRARNAQDATMNITKPIIPSAAKDLASTSGYGQNVGPSPLFRMMATAGFALTTVAAFLLLTPGTGLAANECSPAADPSANGNAADTYTCANGTTYVGGITYAANGDLTLKIPDSTSTTSHLTLSGDGINATATGTDNLFWDSRGFSANIVVPTASSAVDAVLDFSTDMGDITIKTQQGGGGGQISAFQRANVGIRAHSGLNTAASGDGGDIEISAYRVLVDGGVGIEAITDGGDIAITMLKDDERDGIGRQGSIGARKGIYAETSGQGSILINVGSAGVPRGQSTPSAILATEAGVHAIADGDIVINSFGDINGGAAGVGILIDGGGTSTINLLQSSVANGAGALDPLSGISGIRGGAAVIRGVGNNVVVNVSTAEDFASPTRLAGRLDFSALTGAAQLNVGSRGVWRIDTSLATASVFSNGADRVWISADGMAVTPAIQGIWVVDFNGGDDQLVNEGMLRIEGTRSELRLLGLERLVNAGVIDLGEKVSDTFIPTDAAIADDILWLPGTTLVGTESGRIFLDADLKPFSMLQDRCDASLRGSNGRLPVSDCIALHNGNIEGTVLVSLTPIGVGGRGSYNPDGNVIIDLSDGNGGAGSGGLAEGALVALAPESTFYNPALGGIIDNGMFAYRLAYDDEMKQIKLISLPSAGAFHQPIIANAAQSAWRVATGSFFDRQSDLRDTLRGGAINDHGVWLRTAYDDGERKPTHTVGSSAGDTVYDNTHDLQTSSVTLGVDFVRGGDGHSRWVAGGMLGYVRTDIEYAQFWTDTAAMNGMLAGLYGSYIQGPMFVDATISGTWAQLDQQMPQAELYRGRGLTSNVETQGARLEAGWRFDLGVARVEPLLSASWSRTSVDDFKVPEGDPALPGNQVMFDDTTSTRFGAGLRGSTQFPVLGSLQLGLSLTGRVMSESDGEAKARIGNLNPISPEVVDTWDGTFSEFIGGVTLANSTGRVSGVLNIGLRSGDDYSATSGSFSFRYQW